MGWYKEYLQDLADIQAAEDRKNAFLIGALISGFIGFVSLVYVVDFWVNSHYLYSIGCAVLFLLMLPPTFFCLAKSGGGGCAALFCCLIVVSCDIGSVYAMYDDITKHFEGYWKNDNNVVFEIYKDNSGAYFIYDIEGKDIAKKQDNKICGKNSSDGVFCINVKGNSAYIETDDDTTAYTRISKEEYDKTLDTQKKANKAAFETLISQLKSFEGNKAKDCVGFWKGHDLAPLQVTKNGKKYNVKYPDRNGGKDIERSSFVEKRRICNQETKACYNAKELFCEGNVQCMIAKGDSAYYFETTAPYSLWGYIRTDKNDFDKEVKEFRESSSK
jgi:hypothetical protein